ncbi:MAG: DUF3866 family protein [Actinomycetaceae bacterium]|nr:DUF3866 family protein [Actinomycetaceae bacterium]
MMMWRRGEVIEHRLSWGSASEYNVKLDDERIVRALAYTPQVGELEVGDNVLLSGAAFERGLGTGGYMMVVAVPERLPADPPPSPGHIMKARYTPMQFMVQGVDEQESEHHEVMRAATSIEGMPVVVADLHSALPAVVAAIKAKRPAARIAYVMTDGGALPAWFSRAAYTLTQRGDILGTISVGQAYGGELEAVNVHTGLLAAKHVWNADIAVVSQGPGNAGTGTVWGFSGVAVGDALNAAGVLGGQAIACLRLSNADKRERHYGISHHTSRVLKDVVKVPCIVPVPDFADGAVQERLPEGFQNVVAQQCAALMKSPAGALLKFSDVSSAGAYEILKASPVGLRTMGRDLDGDVSAFVGAAAAGSYAASLLE